MQAGSLIDAFDIIFLPHNNMYLFTIGSYEQWAFTRSELGNYKIIQILFKN